MQQSMWQPHGLGCQTHRFHVAVKRDRDTTHLTIEMPVACHHPKARTNCDK